MPVGRITLSPERSVTNEELLDALEGRFGDKYKVLFVGGPTSPHGVETPPRVGITSSSGKAIVVVMGRNEIEVHGGNSMWTLVFVGLFFWLVFPIFILLAERRTAFAEMGEEVTRFLEERYGSAERS